MVGYLQQGVKLSNKIMILLKMWFGKLCLYQVYCGSNKRRSEAKICVQGL